MPKACSVEGCGKRHLARGFCNSHYKRWKKYGDPHGGAIGTGEAQRFYLEVVLGHQGGDCLIWPFARTKAGYGRVQFEGTTHYVHHLVCESRHGPRPSARHDAAHSCGKGHEGCVSAKHLRWALRSENETDKLDHGTDNRGEKHGMARLSQDDVLAIRASKGRVTREVLAERYGVHPTHIGAIQRHKAWAWLGGAQSDTA